MGLILARRSTGIPFHVTGLYEQFCVVYLPLYVFIPI